MSSPKLLLLAILGIALAPLPASTGQPEPIVVHDWPEDSSPEAITAFLKGGTHLHWKADPEPYPSGGPHGMVRTYFNGVLYQSLKDGAVNHPPGSMAIKVLLDRDGTTILGHTISFKDPGTSEWVWFEGSEPNYERPIYFKGIANQCAGCHRIGTDFVVASAPD
jgi:hypothetical protein